MNTTNPTGGDGGYLNLSNPVGADESYWVELDVAAIDFSQYSFVYLLMNQTVLQGASYRESKIQVSYDNGASWRDAFIEYDFGVRYPVTSGQEVFNMSPQLEGRSSVRLRVAAYKDCASSYNPDNCASAEDDVQWDIDGLKLLGWGSPSADVVSGQIDNSVDIFTDSNQTVDITPPVSQGSGETCDDAVVLTRTVYDLDAGDDIANRDVAAQCGAGPNTTGYDPDHDWDASPGCDQYRNYDIEHEYPLDIAGPDKIYTAHMEAGERLWSLQSTGIDSLFYVLDGGCDPQVSSPFCLETPDAEFHGLYEFVAPSAGTYHLVFKARPFDPCDQPWNSNRTIDYNFEVGQFTASEVNCSNGADDAGDGQIECSDPNCFEMCGRDVLFSEYFTDGLPGNLEVVSTSDDGWQWCDATPGACTGPASESGPDYNRFSDSGGGYIILVDDSYGGAPSFATPTIDVSGHGGSNLGLFFNTRYIARNADGDEWSQSKLYVDVIVDGQVVIGRGEVNEEWFYRWTRGTQFIDLSAWAAAAQSIKVRFSVEVPSGLKTNPWRLDDILLTSW